MCLAKTSATPCYTDLYDVASMRRKNLKQTEEGMQRDRVMEVGGTAEIGVGAGQRKRSSLVTSCRVCAHRHKGSAVSGHWHFARFSEDFKYKQTNTQK